MVFFLPVENIKWTNSISIHKNNLNDRRENKRFSKSEKQKMAINKRSNHTTKFENIRFVLNNERIQPAKILSASNELPKLVLPFWQNLERKKINTEKCRTLSFWLSFFP